MSLPFIHRLVLEAKKRLAPRLVLEADRLAPRLAPEAEKFSHRDETRALEVKKLPVISVIVRSVDRGERRVLEVKMKLLAM